MQKLRGWISQTIRMNSNTSSLRASSACRSPEREKPWQGRAAEHAADLIAVEGELGEDPLAGERTDVAEEEHLARLDVGPGGDPAGPGLEQRAVGFGVVAR